MKRSNYKPKTWHIVLIITISLLVVTQTDVFAETQYNKTVTITESIKIHDDVQIEKHNVQANTKNEFIFTKIDGDDIQNNPAAQQILENIKIAKERLAQMQQKQDKISEYKKWLQDQRKIANQKLQEDLARMNKNYEEFTPKASFARFISGVNATHHDIYWEQFNYVDKKINSAHDAVDEILRNGGSRHDAHMAYIKLVKMPKAEMFKVIKELNIKYGFADTDSQIGFDNYGKLPRTEKSE